MPIRKLRCVEDGFTVEESSLIISNLGLPEDFLKHFLLKHKNPDPKEEKDYVSYDAMRTDG